MPGGNAKSKDGPPYHPKPLEPMTYADDPDDQEMHGFRKLALAVLTATAKEISGVSVDGSSVRVRDAVASVRAGGLDLWCLLLDLDPDLVKRQLLDAHADGSLRHRIASHRLPRAGTRTARREEAA